MSSINGLSNTMVSTNIAGANRNIVPLDFYIIGKPKIDLKIKANVDKKKQCASLSIQFKLFWV